MSETAMIAVCAFGAIFLFLSVWLNVSLERAEKDREAWKATCYALEERHREAAKKWQIYMQEALQGLEEVKQTIIARMEQEEGQ
jgi:predicted deacetylase